MPIETLHRAMICKVWLGAICFALPLACCAQKAFEEVNYRSTVLNKPVKLLLANGYPGGTALKLYEGLHKIPVMFLPESGVAAENFKLLPQSRQHHDYFVLAKVAQLYDKPPAIITARYYTGNVVKVLRFYKIK